MNFYPHPLASPMRNEWEKGNQKPFLNIPVGLRHAVDNALHEMGARK